MFYSAPSQVGLELLDVMPTLNPKYVGHALSHDTKVFWTNMKVVWKSPQLKC